MRTVAPGRCRLAFTLALAGALVLAVGCRPDDSAQRASPSTAPAEAYRGTPIGATIEGRPWIAHVLAVDLDRDGLLDVLVCDARANQVSWIRQVRPGEFAETKLASDLPGPVHAEGVDFDGDGDVDVLVASMGQVFPNNSRIGAVYWLENDGAMAFTPRVVLAETTRVSDVRAGDFDGDGRLDLAVAQFGYDQGEVAWLRQRSDGSFERRVLLNRSGAVNVVVADLNGDQTLDLAAIVSQEWEEIHLFENDGRGSFRSRVIYGSTNEDFGSSGLTLGDLNRDGRPDLLFTNGDGFDYAEPGPRPWHGVQWLENLGQGLFRYHRIGDLAGAYSPAAVDLNRDGFTDVVACSGFNDWDSPAAVSLVVFLNDGTQRFTRHVVARAPTHLMTLAIGAYDGPEHPPALVTGGFHAYPPWRDMSRVTLWRRETESR
ncbi:MAG TPA: VCBS repeat-containing protein [Candidatus Synoicihabitans sp.]|nr:VCBS repeat-containing protein [Candidatus Synoicihabitans sp.]